MQQESTNHWRRYKVIFLPQNGLWVMMQFVRGLVQGFEPQVKEQVKIMGLPGWHPEISVEKLLIG